jgi:hypothetical protein
MQGVKRAWTAEEDDRLRRYAAAEWTKHAISVRLGRLLHRLSPPNRMLGRNGTSRN